MPTNSLIFILSDSKSLFASSVNSIVCNLGADDGALFFKPTVGVSSVRALVISTGDVLNSDLNPHCARRQSQILPTFGITCYPDFYLFENFPCIFQDYFP